MLAPPTTQNSLRTIELRSGGVNLPSPPPPLPPKTTTFKDENTSQLDMTHPIHRFKRFL